VDDRFVQAIVLVTDLHTAGRHVEELGLTVLDGGRHPGRGTANLIVPLGHQYLELLAVVDEEEALSSPQGRPVVAALSDRGPGLARWSMESTDIEATSRRVGHPIERRHRLLPDGAAVRWRSVAVDTSWVEPWRCAFMAWDAPSTHPARTPVVHHSGATGFASLHVVVPDMSAALTWFGGQAPPGVVVEVGTEPGVSNLVLSSRRGEIPIGPL
jgi:Glyoxalase-like domain